MKTILLTLTLISIGLTPQLRAQTNANVPTQHNEATVDQLQAEMALGQLTSVQLTNYYIARINALDQRGADHGVNAIIELNPDALALAQRADNLRKQGKVLGPLHGIPVPAEGQHRHPGQDANDRRVVRAVRKTRLQDSTVAANLRAGGAVILGKTNLSSGRTFDPLNRSAAGRVGVGKRIIPTGSIVTLAARVPARGQPLGELCHSLVWHRTDGSIVCPGNANGVVAIKPTVGLTSRAGVVPISHVQDTVGPHARTVADAAAALGIIQSRTFDGRDPATGGVPLGWQGTGKTRPTNIPTDYTIFIDPHGLKGARLGLTRAGLTGFTNVTTPQPVLDAFEEAVNALTAAGATVIDLDAAGFTFPSADGEFLVLAFDFRRDVRAYFATRVGVPVAGGTLQTAIDFNNANADVEMPFFNQDIFEFCASLAQGVNAPQPAFGGLTYSQALAIDHDAGVNGIDKAIKRFNLDAVVSATDNPAWSTDLIYGDHFIFGTSGLAAAPGYPIVQVPAGIVFGAPLGISFFGTAFSEPTLIKLASGFEAATRVRAHNLPTFADTVPARHIEGTTLTRPHPPTSSLKPQEAAKKMPHHM